MVKDCSMWAMLGIDIIYNAYISNVSKNTSESHTEKNMSLNSESNKLQRISFH